MISCVCAGGCLWLSVVVYFGRIVCLWLSIAVPVLIRQWFEVAVKEPFQFSNLDYLKSPRIRAGAELTSLCILPKSAVGDRYNLFSLTHCYPHVSLPVSKIDLMRQT